ncbi:MAG: membrane protein [Armatimonadota bacterium]|nr:MAG: membrane protein [Armatimonadota bacterium]
MPEREDSNLVLQRLEQLERRIEELTQRVERVEQQARPSAPAETAVPTPAEPSTPRDEIAAQPVIPPPPMVPPLSEEVVSRITPEPAETPPPSEPVPPVISLATEAEAPGLGASWEQLVGGKGALWIGSIATFFALAFFLAYTWQLLGDVFKLVVGFTAGAALLAFGEHSRKRVERWFSEGISGAGIAVLYLSIWAGAQRYHLFSFEVSFALMAATVFLGVLLALRYDAMSLSILATIGGFLTPVLLRSEGGTSTTPYPLLTYVTVLNAGILAVSLYRQWRALVWLSFFATILLVLGWAEGSYQESFRWAVFAYVTLNFLLFLGCACFRSLIQRASTQAEELLLVFADTGVYTLAGYALVGEALGSYPSAFALVLAVLFGGLSMLVHQRAPQNRSLRDSLGGIALFFLTIAVPMQLKQDWLVVGWSVQAAVLVALGLRLNSPLLHRAGQIVWMMSLLALAAVVLTVEAQRHLLFLNERGLPLLTAVAATTWMAVESRRAQAIRDELAPWYSALAVLGGAWLLAQETSFAVEWRSSRLGQAWQAVAMYAIAIVWAVYSPLLHWLGTKVSDLWVRFGALLVATLAAVLPVWAMASAPVDTWTPFWNIRWFSTLLVSVLLAVLAWMVAREQQRATPEEAQAFGYLAVLVSILLWIGLSAEVYLGFRAWRMSIDPQLWAVAAWFALVALWSVLGALFVALGVTWNLFGMRLLGYVAGGAAVVVLLMYSLFTLPGSATSVAWVPILNLRALAFIVSTLSAVWIAVLLSRHSSQSTSSEVSLTGGIVALAVVVLLWGITQETYEAFYYWHVTGALQGNWQRVAQMAISLVWTLFGAVMLIVGIVRSLQPVRLAALGLLGFTALKVFLYDLSFLDTPMRILSFGGLGLTLIAISWLYSRYGIGRTGSLRHT